MKKHLLVSAALVLGLLTGHSAQAIKPHELIGDWQFESNGMCLYAPGGFDTHLHPLNPSQSFMTQWTTLGIETFGAPTNIATNSTISGNVTRNFTCSAIPSLHRR